eukprot:403332985
MFLASTITKPNSDLVLYSVATVIHSQMLDDISLNKIIPVDSDLYYFSEEKYFEEKPDQFDKVKMQQMLQIPTVENITEFMKSLHDCAQFRLIAFTEMPLTQSNWRPISLCALMISQKVWDDRYLSNSDFAFIYPFFENEELNRLELKFLELIQYNLTVKTNLYAKYYFEMRSLHVLNKKEFPLIALTNRQIETMGIRNREVEDIYDGEGLKAKKQLNKSFGSLKPRYLWND